MPNCFRKRNTSRTDVRLCSPQLGHWILRDYLGIDSPLVRYIRMVSALRMELFRCPAGGHTTGGLVQSSVASLTLMSVPTSHSLLSDWIHVFSRMCQYIRLSIHMHISFTRSFHWQMWKSLYVELQDGSYLEFKSICF